MKLVGERRALAAVTFAFYFLSYLIVGLLGVAGELSPAFYALAGVYGLAFFALVAGYFWARWYAVGVGLYGVITSAAGLWQVGAEPVLLFLGGTHLVAVILLWGSSMSETYDGQTAWREKLHMDENAVQRLGRSVIRAGVSLPLVLLYALAPKPGGATLALSVGALVLAAFGLRAVVKARTWGVVALGTAGALMLTAAGADLLAHHDALALRASLGGALLVSSATPFFAPMLRFLSFAR
ncbi:MAG: hypothetical protein JWO36_6786 [Myxococcales bacterium]|nr:hypothetical protein [Myxococcales bacterium]